MPEVERNALKNIKKLLRKGSLGLGGALVALVAVMLIKASLWGSVQLHPAPVPPPEMDLDAAAARLGAAIRLKTISNEDPAKVDAAAFAALHKHLEESFPNVHKHLQREVIEGGGLLYTWAGSAKGEPGVLLAAHLDVVPVEAGTEGEWERPPFSGEVSGGFIWGRGAMDDKMSALATLEAVELLLAQGFAPRRDVFLAFGHDEEVGGHKGAAVMAGMLKERGVRLLFVLDEGLVITDGIVPGLKQPAALVGVANKGYVSVELVAQGEGGHSSMPPRETAVGLLSRAVARLEEHPMPARLDGAAAQTFRALGPEMGFGQRVAFANLWLLRGVVLGQLTGAPSTNALVRTTTAPTMLEGSVQDNVLPARARAVVNFRILPGDSVQRVLEHVQRVVADDRVAIKALGGLGDEPSAVSDPAAAPFKLLETTLREVYPDALVAPGLFIAIGDARHYEGLSENIYRFLPLRMRPEDRPRFHGTNERLAVAHYGEAIAFYHRLLRQSAGAP